jgi:hypothetical protein
MANGNSVMLCCYAHYDVHASVLRVASVYFCII